MAWDCIVTGLSTITTASTVLTNWHSGQHVLLVIYCLICCLPRPPYWCHYLGTEQDLIVTVQTGARQHASFDIFDQPLDPAQGVATPSDTVGDLQQRLVEDISPQSLANCGIGSDQQLPGRPVNCGAWIDRRVSFWIHLQFLYLQFWQCTPLTNCGIGSVFWPGQSAGCSDSGYNHTTEIWTRTRTFLHWHFDNIKPLSSQSHCRVGSCYPLSGLTVNPSTDTEVYTDPNFYKWNLPWCWNTFLIFWHLAQAYWYQILHPLTHCGIGSVQLAGLSEDCNSFYCQQTAFFAYFQQLGLHHIGRSTGQTTGSQSHCRVGSCPLLTGLTEFLAGNTGVGTLTDCPIQERSNRLVFVQHHFASTSADRLVANTNSSIDTPFWDQRSSTHCRVGSCSLTGLSRTQQQNTQSTLQPLTLALAENNFSSIWWWIPLIWLALFQWFFAYFQFSQLLQFTVLLGTDNCAYCSY